MNRIVTFFVILEGWPRGSRRIQPRLALHPINDVNAASPSPPLTVILFAPHNTARQLLSGVAHAREE
jgi:hypothetical protein